MQKFNQKNSFAKERPAEAETDAVHVPASSKKKPVRYSWLCDICRLRHLLDFRACDSLQYTLSYKVSGSYVSIYEDSARVRGVDVSP
jgi:hypothetical protein